MPASAQTCWNSTRSSSSVSAARWSGKGVLMTRKMGGCAMAELAPPYATLRARASAGSRLLAADGLDALPHRGRIERLEGKGRQLPDAALEHQEGLLERAPRVLVAACNRRGVREAPVRRDGVTWPEGARLASRLITHRDDEVHARRVRSGKLVPALAPQSVQRDP